MSSISMITPSDLNLSGLRIHRYGNATKALFTRRNIDTYHEIIMNVTETQYNKKGKKEKEEEYWIFS